MKRSYGILYLVALLALASCNDDKGSPSSQKQAVTTTGGATTGVVPQPATTYTVTFETNGGTAVASAAVEQGKTLAVPPPPTRQGFGFGGWYTHKDAKEDKDEFKFDKPIVANLTLYARWSSSFYTITFDVGGGTPIADLQVEQNKPATLPPAQKKDDVFDLAFDSWYTDPGLTKPLSPSAPIIGNTMLYAKYHTDYRLITTAKQLQAVALPQNLKHSYKLQNDIDLQDAPWTPIGATFSEPFSGVLDGNGHRVKGLYIHIEILGRATGLIGVNMGTIKNIGVQVSAKGIKGVDNVGALVGDNQEGATVQGYASGGMVEGNTNVGGLVGHNYKAAVSGHVAQMRISCKGIGEGGGPVGGLVGLSEGVKADPLHHDAVRVYGYVEGIEVTSMSNRIGGLVGFSNGSHTWGYAEGTINAINPTGSIYVGGLVGRSHGDVHGYFKGTVNGARGVGGLVGSQDGFVVQGYVRAVVSRTRDSNPDFGRLVGTDDDNVFHVFGAIPADGNYSDKETHFGGGVTAKGPDGIDGAPVTISANTAQKDFNLSFGPNLGQWQFTPGRWPSINLPAEVGGNYKAQDQPTAP